MVESIVEKCVEQVHNRFKLVLLASQRTHDLSTGASDPVEMVKFKDHKDTIVSLYEIAEKKVNTHELFNLLVKRCKEHMKGNTDNTYINTPSKLANLLNFSDHQLNTSLDVSQESHDDEIDDQDSGEEVPI
ncbi:DNA-directed RNA polymerase subunit omega [Wolbachia endosymbiont (group B) of Cyclophora punctaria]|uniref:DNA-directed RNA polymerase subunit omega n=1 Tax=Wolbachia endosymbiont (group B) of Cyclophora punctaria TaxID=3066168 RepID=UPI00334198FB